MATAGPGGAISCGGIIEIYNKKINLDDIQDNDLELLINYTNELLEKHIEAIEKNPKSKKKVFGFSDKCKEIIDANNRLKNNLLPQISRKSEQYKTLLKKIVSDLYYKVSNEIPIPDIEAYNEYSSYYEETITPSLGKILNLPKIEIFAENKKRIISIVGGNGAGKSSFIGFLKDLYSNEMIVIPAQKLLIYDNNINGITQKVDSDLRNILQENIIQALRSTYQSISINNVSSNFSTLVSVIANRTIMEQNEYFENKKKYLEEGKIKELKKLEETETILDCINKIWSKVIKNIKFYLNTETHCLEPKNADDNRYNINSMSDGEKAILYYIGNILLADKCSYIVIDEPETYLNPSIYKLLWDILEEERKDCQFIYITHEIDFVRTRRNSDLLWMKKYNNPHNWDIIRLEDIKFPKELLIEIYGSKNKILFCEGDKESWDYSIYSILFGTHYSIIPVGSCLEVCKYTEAFNNATSFHNNEAIGIIDYDNRPADEIKKLKDKNIYVTKYNEIEMLLMDEEVIRKTLDNFEPDIVEDKLKKFKAKFFEKVSNQKDKIVFDFIKKVIDESFNNYRIVSEKKEDIKIELSDFIDSLEYEKKYDEFNSIIKKELDNKEYNNLLKYCNLKKEITRGLANKELIPSYEEQAIGAIRNSLSKYIKDKYFCDISTK